MIQMIGITFDRYNEKYLNTSTGEGRLIMRTEQLRYFVMAVNLKSINKAADELYISQSTVSEALKRLEEELDLTLLIKNRKGVCMTPAGEIFYKTASRILQELDDFQDATEQFRKYQNVKMREKIVMSITPEINDWILPKLLNRINSHFSKKKFLLAEGDFIENIQMVIADKVDCAVVTFFENVLEDQELREILRQEGIYTKILCRSKVTAVVNKESSLANKNILSMKDALKMPLAIYNAHLETRWHEKCFACFGQPNIVFISGSSGLGLKYVSMNKDVLSFTNQWRAFSQMDESQVAIPIKEAFYYAFIYVTKQSHKKENNALQTIIAGVIEETLSGIPIINGTVT